MSVSTPGKMARGVAGDTYFALHPMEYEEQPRCLVFPSTCGTFLYCTAPDARVDVVCQLARMFPGVDSQQITRFFDRISNRMLRSLIVKNTMKQHQTSYLKKIFNPATALSHRL